MNLLMISGDRSVLRGAQGAFWYTLSGLRMHFDRIDVICPRVRNATLKPHAGGAVEVSDGGGRVFFHPCPRGLWYQPWWILRRGRQLFDVHRHAVMTVHEYPPFHNGIGALWLFKKTRIPFILEVHHIVGLPRAASPQEWVGRMLSRMFLPRHAALAASVRVVNASVQATLTRWGVPEGKIRSVPSFYLDRALLSQSIRPPVSYDISFAGRLVQNKRLRTLIEAIEGLPDVRLLVVGDGPERFACAELARRLGMENRVKFLGWVPDAEAVFGALQTARIFVMNSLSEGGPRVALEAMGCGMPVIVTPVGVMPEVIEDGVNGIFTDGSAGDLRRKVARLLDDESLRERLGREARKILDRFDRSTLIRQYADFLKSAALPLSSS